MAAEELPNLKSTDASLVDVMEHANSLHIMQIALGASRTPIWRQQLAVVSEPNAQAKRGPYKRRAA